MFFFVVGCKDLTPVIHDPSHSNLIIGMDIICAGDLSISNYEKTVFCYSFPAHCNHIDLVDRANKINRKSKLVK